MIKNAKSFVSKFKEQKKVIWGPQAWLGKGKVRVCLQDYFDILWKGRIWVLMIFGAHLFGMRWGIGGYDMEILHAKGKGSWDVSNEWPTDSR